MPNQPSYWFIPDLIGDWSPRQWIGENAIICDITSVVDIGGVDLRLNKILMSNVPIYIIINERVELTQG
ncbi:MAG TPA: hypothetical protein VG722_13380 [Tepidisphaeraceae bacterium]|nr:hypothetical protein [Tepidisphaeraceae bacterium]